VPPPDAVGDAPVLIAQVSDIHLGADVDDIAESLVVDLAAQRPDVTVVSGDLTMRARSEQFARARDYLDRLPHPVLVVPGNHDIPLYNVLRRFSAPFEKYQRYIDDELDPELTVPGVTILGLNSMPHWRWKAGHISDRQADLVRTALGGAPSDSLRVLVTHHPVLPRELSGLVGRSALVSACADAGVDLLLAGHTHDPQIARVRLTSRAVSRQALSLVAGTAVSQRTRGSLNCYFVVEVGTHELVVRERQWAGGGAWVEGMSAHFTRDAGSLPPNVA
jgi:3',5'-cyclic AMP phosphodiesterase CpdA